MDNVQFEVQSILLRIRDYKKTNQLSLGSLGQVFAQGTLNGLLKYEDQDEHVQVALINFYSKITYLQGKEVLETMIDAVSKISSVNQILLEKKLKFIRNAFEHPELDTQLLSNLIKLNRQIESSVPNLLIRELARDSLSQGLKKMSHSCTEELLLAALHDLRNEVLQQIANRNNETVKLIEYPYSIMFFMLQLRKPNQFIIQYYIPMLLQLVKFDHPVIWNYLNQAMLFVLKLSMDNQLGDDLQETRTLFGQIVLKGITNHLNRLQNMTIPEMALQCEIDSHFYVRFLMEIFGSKEKIKYIFSKCDMNPFQKPIFCEVVEKIFELSRVARKLQCDDGRMLQKQIYELQVQLFKVGLAKKSSQQTLKLQQFLSDFTAEPRKAIKNMPQEQVVNFLKYCNLYNETLMIEILGCHKEECIQIMEKYVNTFDYSQLSLVEAFRYLTSNFLLFGESQMIERVLNAFTIRYFEQNQEITHFKHPDYLFTYTYAILLLNTDLYNKTVTKHMSLDDFKKQCQKINNGENLPNEVLVADYNNIQQDEIKCIRDFATTDDLSQFVWDKYLQTREETKTIYEEMLKYFEVQIDSDHYGDQVLTLMVHNIEELVAQTQDVQELTQFLNQVIQICISSDKLESANQILISVMKLNSESTDQLYEMSLYAGFYIAEQLLQSVEQFQPIINLINNSIMQRHKLGIDNVSYDCRNVLRKIKVNNDFGKRFKGSNKGVTNLLTQFFGSSLDEESDDDYLNEQPQLQIKFPQLLINLIQQTKFLDDDRLNQFLSELLQSLNTITDFKLEYIRFAQIIYIAVEILRVNTDRLLQFWPVVVNILTQKQKFDGIKKKSIKQLLQAYCGYTLLKLVIEFLHKSDSLNNYYEYFKQGLEYLNDQSLEILNEFLQEIKQFLKQKSEVDFSMSCLNNVVKLLLIIFAELEKKTLDQNDANILLTLIQEIYEEIQRYQAEKELVQILRKHLEILNNLLKQKQLLRISSGFIAKSTQQIMITYEKYIHEQDNGFLNELLTLAMSLSAEHLQQVIQIIMQVILNYNYSNLSVNDFTNLFNQITSKQQLILQSNNDQMLVNYSQYLQRMYFNWIQKDRFTLSIWLELLKKFGEILQTLKQNKSPQHENVSLAFQCVCQNQYFQEILKGILQSLQLAQNNEVQEKTKQFGKQHNLELIT